MPSSFEETAPFGFAWVPTLSDTVDQPRHTRAILVGVAGNVACTMFDPTTQKLANVILPLPVGTTWVRTNRILTTGTTATGIVALA